MATEQRKTRREKDLVKAGREAIAMARAWRAEEDRLNRSNQELTDSLESARQVIGKLEKVQTQARREIAKVEALNHRIDRLEEEVSDANQAAQEARDARAVPVRELGELQDRAKQADRFKRKYTEERAKVLEQQREINRLKVALKGA